MREDEFFHLAHPESWTNLGEWTEEMNSAQIICPLDDGHRRGGMRLTGLSLSLPRSTVDGIVWTWMSECLLTEGVLELFRSHGFTGFEVKPVQARYKRSKKVPPKLWELIVTGWAGMAGPESGIKLIEHCAGCGHLVYSESTRPEKIIVRSQWDGSDFFMVWPLPRYIFITERVAKVIRDNAISGCVLTPAASLVFSTDVIPGFSPGRLSYWMPERRARELGEPLGIY